MNYKGRVFVCLVSFTILCSCGAKQGFGPGDQDWGYVTVREKAHMFWWLFYNTASNDASERPLIIWLQGGPGGSSTGIGNFEEIGPLTLDKQRRTTAWTNFANILFVDNPVGTGFSYVEDEVLLASNNIQIAEDFLVFLETFFKDHPKFANIPFYIFGQSYGGKMAVDIALLIIEKSKNKNSEINLKGIGLGDAWVSPMDSLLTWSPFLHCLGFVDQYHADLLNIATNYGQSLYDEHLYANVTQIFIATQTLVMQYAGRVDFYNVMNKIDGQSFLKVNNQGFNFVLPSESDNDDIALDVLMNTQVAAALNVTKEWGAQRDAVFNAVQEDFMKSVTEGVEKILNETDLTVTVYNGQLDLIVPTIGTEKWIENLKWKGTESWKKAIDDRNIFTINGVAEGYEKIIGNLQFYWVNRAGHSLLSTLDRVGSGPGVGCVDGGGGNLPPVVPQPQGLPQLHQEVTPKQAVVERLKRRIESYRRRQNDCMPRYDQSFTGLCEQGLQDTLHLKQRYLDAKSKRVSKAKEKKQDNTASGAGIQSSVHVQQKFLKRSVDDLDSSGADNFGEPPVKLQCNNEGLTKFSVEIVQQLEFTTSAANSQPQQISTNVTVKTHANTSVKSDVSSPKSNPATPQNQQQSQQHQQKSNIGLDIGLDVKQEPDNDFADLDSCAAALEKDAAANGGAGFGASFPDLMGEDDNGDMSDAFKDLISDISNYHDYPELMKELDFEDKSDLGVLKMEDSKDHAHIPLNPDLKHPQNHMLGNQNNFSNPMFEKNGMSGRMPYSSVPNMDFTKTELSPAAQTLKQMAEQHQHKNQMGLNFNPANRAPNVRSPYQDFQNFQGEYNSPNSNPNFKNNPNFPSPDMIKQEMIYQGDFNEVKRKAQSAGGMYPNKQQYSPYGSPGSGPGGHVSPGFLPNRGAAGQPTPNSGQFGGAGTPPRPPSGSGGGPQGQGGTTLQINQAQHLNITQQSQGHNIQVSAGQHVHLSGDLKGNVSIATQQGMHFTHQQHQSNPNGGQSQNKNNQQSSQGGNNQSNSGSQANHMAGNNQGPMNQQSSQQMNPNLNQMHQQMPNQQSNMSNMSNPNSSIPNMGNNQSMGPNSAMGGNPTMGGNGNPGNGGMPGALGSMMGGPNMPHGAMGHGDSYSMSQTQTINFTQQNLRRATGMGNSMGGPNTMGPGGPMAGPTGSMGPRLISAQTMEQQKLMQQQHMLRAQQAAMQQQQLRPPPPDYKASAGLGQGGMQPRFGTPAPPPNMRRMPHQPIPPSGPMIRSNMQYMLQQQQQQMPVRQAIFRGQQTPMGMEMQQNSAEWRHMMMSQQQNVSFGGMRPGFQQGGFNMNASGNPMQHQMSALQHQQQLRSQQAMGNNQGGLGQLMTHNGGPMAQMNSMNQAMLHMQQQQNMMQQQNSQMSMSSLHMQQSQSLSVNNMQNSMSSQNSGALLNESINSVVSSGASGQTNNTLNPGNNPLSGFNPGTDFNFEFLDNLPGTNDTTPFTDQELLNSFDADSGFTLDF